MAKRRFVLRYQGDGPKPVGDVERMRGIPGATVIDESARMVLVESEEELLRKVVDSMEGWFCAPQNTLHLPDTRRRVWRPPR